MINHLSGDTLNTVITKLSAATPQNPLTRAQVAQTANVERQAVGEILSELRLQGYLILENENGCWLGASYAEYKEWRTKTLIPTMLHLLQTDQTMALNAAMQFGAGREATG